MQLIPGVEDVAQVFKYCANSSLNTQKPQDATLPGCLDTKSLNWKSHLLSDTDVAQFAKTLLPKLTSLTHIDLTGTKITDVGAIAISQTLPSLISLTQMRLASNKLTDAG